MVIDQSEITFRDLADWTTLARAHVPDERMGVITRSTNVTL